MAQVLNFTWIQNKTEKAQDKFENPFTGRKHIAFQGMLKWETVEH